MQTPRGVFGVLEAREDVLVLVELPLLDRDVDPDDVLPDDAARADIQMSVCSILFYFYFWSAREGGGGDGDCE